jgi:hypothetical protein
VTGSSRGVLCQVYKVYRPSLSADDVEGFIARRTYHHSESVPGFGRYLEVVIGVITRKSTKTKWHIFLRDQLVWSPWITLKGILLLRGLLIEPSVMSVPLLKVGISIG